MLMTFSSLKECNMIKITVSKPTCKLISGTSAKGRSYELYIQEAHAFCVDAETGAVNQFPDKFEIVLPKGQKEPFPAGDYTLSSSSVFVDRDGRLSVTPRLVPIKPAPVAPIGGSK